MSASNFVDTYLSMINGPLKGLNLTRITSPDDFEAKQFKDSIAPFEINSELKTLFEDINIVVDIGFGGGFPILPLAWSYRTKQYLGIESREKKVKAVKLISKEMKLTNTRLIHARFEEVNFDKNVLIVSKAVDKIENILKSLNFSHECYVGFYKGPELDQLENIHATNDKLLLNFEYEISGNYKRKFLLYKCVPRGTNTKKKLVNVSELLLP